MGKENIFPEQTAVCACARARALPSEIFFTLTAIKARRLLSDSKVSVWLSIERCGLEHPYRIGKARRVKLDAKAQGNGNR